MASIPAEYPPVCSRGRFPRERAALNAARIYTGSGEENYRPGRRAGIRPSVTALR